MRWTVALLLLVLSVAIAGADVVCRYDGDGAILGGGCTEQADISRHTGDFVFFVEPPAGETTSEWDLWLSLLDVPEFYLIVDGSPPTLREMLQAEKDIVDTDRQGQQDETSFGHGDIGCVKGAVQDVNLQAANNPVIWGEKGVFHGRTYSYSPGDEEICVDKECSYTVSSLLIVGADTAYQGLIRIRRRRPPGGSVSRQLGGGRAPSLMVAGIPVPGKVGDCFSLRVDRVQNGNPVTVDVDSSFCLMCAGIRDKADTD